MDHEFNPHENHCPTRRERRRHRHLAAPDANDRAGGAACHALWNSLVYTFFGAGEKIGQLGITDSSVWDPERGYAGLVLAVLAAVLLWQRLSLPRDRPHCAVHRTYERFTCRHDAHNSKKPRHRIVAVAWRSERPIVNTQAHLMEKRMITRHKIFPLKHLFIMDASGTLDLQASKAALERLAASPGFDSQNEILLDLRYVDCHMSMSDLYEMGKTLGWPAPALPTLKKIAILVAGHTELGHAQFLATCGINRGIRLAAFDDYDKADEWLTADLPEDVRGKAEVGRPQMTPLEARASHAI